MRLSRSVSASSSSRSIVVEALESRRLLYSGAIWTTVADCSVVNGNIYDQFDTVLANKMTVYLNGGPSANTSVLTGQGLAPAALPPNTAFFVRVTDPSGKTVLGSSYVVVNHTTLLNKTISTDATGKLPCTRVWDVVGYPNGNNGSLNQGFQDTPNPGGEYKVWISTTNDFAPQNSKTDNFKVKPPRGMHGHKFHDHNGNGIQDAEDEGIGGIVIFLDNDNTGNIKYPVSSDGVVQDSDGDGIWQPGEGNPWTVTSADGEWSIIPATDGTYTAREVNPPGWSRASDNPASVTVVTGQKVMGGKFGNFKKIKVSGQKYNDLNANGQQDAGEYGLDGFTFDLIDKNGAVVATTTSQDVDLDGNGVIDPSTEMGVIQFSNVGPGQFTIKEETPPSPWVQTQGANGYTFNTRSGEAQNGFEFGNHMPLVGRMTGGGSIFNNGIRVTHGFQIHAAPGDVSALNNRLQVNWAKQRFHLTSLLTADGMDNPAYPLAKGATINEIRGTGIGSYNGKSGATIQFDFVDAGEPGTSDTAQYKIIYNGSVVLDTGTHYLTYGNHKAHKEIASINSTANQIQNQIDQVYKQMDNNNLTDDQVTSFDAQLLSLYDQYELALLS